MNHNHHIIPRHMGGTNDPNNLIKLSVVDHAAAHLKLYEEYGKYEDWLAWKCLSGQGKNLDFIKERIKLGGYKQGRINRENGHMKQIQKLTKFYDGSKKGGQRTIELGKGSFGNPTERLKSATKGGQVQGKRNADSGHLKRIALLSRKKDNTGKFWITNGKISKMIEPTENIPDGYRRGRVQKRKNI